MTGDPDDKAWLDPDRVSARWNSWQKRFVRHYNLNESQAGSLNRLIFGNATFAAPLKLDALPEGIDLAAAKLKGKTAENDTMWFDAKTKELKVSGRLHLTATERDALLEQIEDKQGPEYDAFRTALEDVFTKASKLSYIERVRAHLVGDPDVDGRIDGRIGQIDLYNEMLKRYEQKLASAEVSFERDHLTRIWSDAREKARDLAGPVIALDKELKEAAMAIPTVDQLKRGPLPDAWTPLKVVDTLTIAGLTGLGILLIVGLFSRFAAFSAAFMVLGFYLAMPPLPGVPEAPGPEHSFIVNKNLVEVMALLALASVPTGYWFGLDQVISKILRRRKAVPKPA